MTDGLYLKNTWVAQVDVAFTFQGNDLTKPDSIQSTYSNSFTLPDTLAIRDLLENAEQVDAGGKYPYELLPAKLIDNGSIVFRGLAQLISFQAGWKVNLVGASKGLLDQMTDLKLRDLDLSRYDHLWSLPVITGFAGASSGIVYPVIDYGSFDNDTFASDALFPAVYAHTLVRQMLQQVGYRPAGTWLDDELIKRVGVPFVDDDAQSQDADWVQDRSAYVTVATVIPSAQEINRVIPFTVDNNPPIFFDGKQGNFKPGLNAYQPDVAMRLRVQASQSLSVTISYGAVEGALIIEKNGQNVAQTYFSVSGPYNLTGTKVDTLVLDELITCRANDQIRIRFTFGKRTLLADWTTILFIEPEKTWASFTPDATIRPGDNWLVARNLPADMSCLDLLVTLALMTSSSYQVDDSRKTINLIPVDSVVAASASAVDWSDRVEESEEPVYTPTLEPYGQSNYVRWKEFDFPAELNPTTTASSASSGTPRALQIGDGVISSSAQNLPSYTELFELPFAACQDSDKTLVSYGAPVLIRTRKLTSSGTSVTVEKSATTPRLILIEASKTVVTKANGLSPDDVVVNDPVTLTGCWWGKRSNALVLDTNAFSLAFDRVDASQREQTLIVRQFKGLKRILRRPRLLTVSVYLRPEDIEQLDLTKPVRLQKVRAGSLVLNDGFYYVSKISNYRSVTTCSVDLVAFF